MMSARKRAQRRGAPDDSDAAAMSDRKFAELQELLRDAESCARLSQWEEEFLSDMRARVLRAEQGTMISDKQWQVIARITLKVYA